MDTNPLEAVLVSFVNNLPQDQPLGLAHSGGPDSTALGACLVKLGWGPQLLCYYVDHQDRSPQEMQAEVAFVQECWRRWGVRGRILSGPILGEKTNFEGVARKKRYEALLDAARSDHLSCLLLAHTKNDNLETLLTRLFQGKSYWGMRGIPQTRGIIQRPLLGLDRKHLLAWLEANQQAYFSDSSNHGNNLRARLRQILIPALDQVFPAWRTALTEAAQRLVPQTHWSWQPEGSGFSLNRHTWDRLTVEERVDALLQVYRGPNRLRRKRISLAVQQEREFVIEGWRLSFFFDRIVWEPFSSVVNLAKNQYFQYVAAGSTIELNNRRLRVFERPDCPHEFWVVHPEDGDHWHMPPGCPSFRSVVKRCMAPGGKLQDCHLLVNRMTVYGVLGSLNGGQDWTYQKSNLALWQWEENERF